MKSLMKFTHINAKTANEAVAALAKGKAVVIAGGTDLLGRMRFEILPDEIVTEIQVPAPAAGVKSAFVKFALRTSIDFPIVNCAAAIGGGYARICLNAVYNLPYRATKAEDAIKGKTIDEANAEAAGAAAVQGAMALPYNAAVQSVGVVAPAPPYGKWKIQVAKAMVKRAVLGCK